MIDKNIFQNLKNLITYQTINFVFWKFDIAKKMIKEIAYNSDLIIKLVSKNYTIYNYEFLL